MISVCFITKNEERWIGECIDHLKPLVTEFILVDTGSTDGTIEIARSKGAKVSSISWPGDFATARNVSLSQATQPWVMKIDPDERLDPQDFPRFRELTQKDGVGYQCWTRAYTNDPSRVTTPSYQVCRGEYAQWERGYRGFLTYPSIRLFRRFPGVRFVGKIHETVEPTLPGWKDGRSPIPPAVDIYFHHFGHSQEAFEEKGKAHLYKKLIRAELESNPENWYVLFELGNEFFANQNFDEAIEMFRRADKAHPRKTQVLSNLGYALILKGKIAEGEKFLRQCLEVDPFYHDAWLNLGVSRLLANDFPLALKSFDHCLKIDPKSFVALRAKGQCLCQLRRFEEAAQIFRRAVELLPHFSEAKVDLGILYLELKRRDSAIECFSEVLRDEPTNPRALAFLEKAQALV